MTKLPAIPLGILSFCVVAFFSGCASVEDKVEGHGSNCEVHNLAMNPKKVAETFGLRVTSSMDEARPQFFPHADEAYDTRACARSHRFVRVYICSACTEARTSWLATHPQ